MDNAIAKMRAGRFIKNNGRVLRTINLLRYKYEKLEEVKYALEDMPENEYLDSLNYLSEAGYIQMRRVTSKQIAEIADVDFRGCNTFLCCSPITMQGQSVLFFVGAVVDCTDVLRQLIGNHGGEFFLISVPDCLFIVPAFEFQHI